MQAKHSSGDKSSSLFLCGPIIPSAIPSRWLRSEGIYIFNANVSIVYGTIPCRNCCARSFVIGNINILEMWLERNNNLDGNKFRAEVSEISLLPESICIPLQIVWVFFHSGRSTWIPSSGDNSPPDTQLTNIRENHICLRYRERSRHFFFMKFLINFRLLKLIFIRRKLVSQQKRLLLSR